jgi:hypothetical protein
MQKLVFALLSLGTVACAPIEHQAVIEQPTGAILTAGPGDVMARVDKQRNLENIFGKADIYGRKTNEGYSEIHYGGIDAKGDVLLYRTDVNIVTNETTMSRSPFSSSYTTSHSSGSAAYGGGVVEGSANGTSSTISMAPISDFHAVIPQGSQPIILPPAPQDLAFEGHALKILTASAGMITYQIQQSPAANR